jgi:hypothetical protein
MVVDRRLGLQPEVDLDAKLLVVPKRQRGVTKGVREVELTTDVGSSHPGQNVGETELLVQAGLLQTLRGHVGKPGSFAPGRLVLVFDGLGEILDELIHRWILADQDVGFEPLVELLQARVRVDRVAGHAGPHALRASRIAGHAIVERESADGVVALQEVGTLGQIEVEHGSMSFVVVGRENDVEDAFVVQLVNDVVE